MLWGSGFSHFPALVLWLLWCGNKNLHRSPGTTGFNRFKKSVPCRYKRLWCAHRYSIHLCGIYIYICVCVCIYCIYIYIWSQYMYVVFTYIYIHCICICVYIYMGERLSPQTLNLTDVEVGVRDGNTSAQGLDQDFNRDPLPHTSSSTRTLSPKIRNPKP